MIDDALLRPGRLEVQVEISLPDEDGRLEILNIHTSRMKEFKKISADVENRVKRTIFLKNFNFNYFLFQELATLTKNFSGAEIEGLIRAAQATAMNRLIKASSKVEVDPEAIHKLLVNRSDFLNALENDIKPVSQLKKYILKFIKLSKGIRFGFRNPSPVLSPRHN